MKIKMNICASGKDVLYNHGNIYEVGKDLTEHMAKSFIEVGFATVVKENSPKEEKTKKVAKKKKNEN